MPKDKHTAPAGATKTAKKGGGTAPWTLGLGWLFSFLLVILAALLMLLCSLGTACAWEIMEFAVDVLAGQESQGHVPPEVLAQLEAKGITGVAAAWEGMKYVSVLDTDLDMLCHFGGSLLFCAHYVVHALTGKNLLMGSLIKDISGAEMNVSARRAGAAEPCFEEPADKRE